MVTLAEIKLVHDFLSEKNIDHVLTGSCALILHGMLDITAVDIDMIIPVNSANYDYVVKELKTQSKLSGMPEQYYPDSLGLRISFAVGTPGIKVDCFVVRAKSPEDIPALPTIIKQGSDDEFAIKLHALDEIMRAKLSLSRGKDFIFLNKMFVKYSMHFITNETKNPVEPCSKK